MPRDFEQQDIPGDLTPKEPKSSLTPEVSSGADMAGGDSGKKNRPDTPLTPEQEDGLKDFLEKLVHGYIDDALKVFEKLNVPESVMQSPEVLTATKEGVVKMLYRVQIDDAIKTVEEFGLPSDLLISHEAQEAISHGVASLIENGHFNEMSRVVEQTSLSEEDIRLIAAEVYTEMKGSGFMGTARTIKKQFKLSKKERMIAAEDVVAEYIATPLPIGYIDIVIDSLDLSKKAVRASASRALEMLLKKGEVFDDVGLIERYGLNAGDVQFAVKGAVISMFEAGRQARAYRLVRKYNLPEDIMNSPEVLDAIRRGISERF